MGVAVVSPVTEFVRLTCDRSPRVLLLTDAAAHETIPEPILRVVDDIRYGSISRMNETLSSDFDGALIWCKSERPIAGTSAEWRRPYFSKKSASSISVAVHWSYLEHADLLGLEPRLLRPSSQETTWTSSLRIAGSNPSEKRKTAWRACGKPWARLSSAIWHELEKPGSALDSFLDLWRASSKDTRFSALVLRNLIVVLMKCQKWEKAGELLDLGIKAFPGCAEFPYLHAVYFILQNSPSKAVKFLEAAIGDHSREFVGIGGENSYRAKFLLGQICEMIGQQEKAVHFWLSGVVEQPAFRPSVEALSRQRLPRGQARWLHHPLAETVRQEPKHLELVLNFLILNGLTAAARRLAETMDLEAAERERLLIMVAGAESRHAGRPRMSDSKPGIELTGPVFDVSGHSRINRALGHGLLESAEFDASLEPTTWPTVSTQTLKYGEALRKGVGREIDHVDLTIRHQWPPDFTRPASGKLVCILPWEHNAVPVRWIEEIEEKVDQVWTPSQFTRNALVQAGVASNRVQVVPNGIDPEIFRPEGPATRPPNSKGFIFLFVGGTILRKGIDLLLQAFGDAFLPEEDVTLVVKDLGSRSFYSHNTKLGEVKQFAARRLSPHTITLTEDLDDEALAALYRGADALVLPYRGEGFGMPLIEAMACGKPVITTGAGPAMEFCTEQEGYLVAAREVEVPEPPPPLGSLSSQWTWFEPSAPALASTMRRVFEHRDEAAAKGRNAAASIESRFTWKRILPMYLERIRGLVPNRVPVPLRNP
jgi:glycosyltransferase involved in cell wall biosynthesis